MAIEIVVPALGESVTEATVGQWFKQPGDAVNAYEPGSVAKVITIAAGLNQGTVTPDTTFVVPWRRKYADDLISDSHQHPDDLMSVERILVESSNIGTIDVQMTLGNGDWDLARQTHWEYMRRFGLGERTALDFPGESSGILKLWSDLWGSERVTVAYGQGVASTSIQLVSAVNAIANDGTYVAPRLVQPNEIVAFDTDLIGAYGFCIDISRTWWVGDTRPSNAMVSAFHHALDHIADHKARLKPGVTIEELVMGGHQLAPEFWAQKYSCKMHGVGLCDEWPYVNYPDGWTPGAFDAALEPGMVLCVEALVSPEGGDFSIKLEDQVLITDTGCETLTRYPFDPRLMG